MASHMKSLVLVALIIVAATISVYFTVYSTNQTQTTAASYKQHTESQQYASNTLQVTAPQTYLSTADINYKKQVLDAKIIALELIQSDGWNKEIGDDDVKGIVFSKRTASYGKVFKLQAEIETNIENLFRELTVRASESPKWNPTLLKVKLLHKIDASSDISYSVSAEAASGLVKSRDFVYVRHWEKDDGWFIIATVSTDFKSAETETQYVRGEQGPGIMRMKEITTSRIKFEWLMNTNLKGWLSSLVVDPAMSSAMMAYLDHLRKHSQTYKNQEP